MHLRRTIALATGAIALFALTSCGFNYATDREYTPGVGVNNHDTAVDVLGAVIVSADDGSGVFIASFSNSDVDEAATVEGLSSVESGALTVKEFDPVEIPAGGLVNLAEADEQIDVTGDFEVGDFVGVLVQFGDGSQAEMDIPVVTNCGYYEGLNGPSDPEQCEPESPAAEH
jgi:hypothetical protein